VPKYPYLPQVQSQCHLAYRSIKALTCMFVPDGSVWPFAKAEAYLRWSEPQGRPGYRPRLI
jgi:hypothetical protein